MTVCVLPKSLEISIHAPRKRSDGGRLPGIRVPLYFYPRSPQEERQAICAGLIWLTVFLSTLPARGAT